MDAEPSLIRTFVALAVSDEVRRNLTLVETQAKRIRVRVGWVKPANLHVTMAFLGYVPSGALAEVADRLEAAARGFQPFGFETAGIGWFGGRRPRVIWAGVPGPAASSIVHLAEAVRTAVREAGYPDDEREAFTPHVTVGRLRPGSDPRELMDFLRTRHAVTPFGPTWCASLLLMRSDQGKEGTVYTVVRECPFSEQKKEDSHQ